MNVEKLYKRHFLGNVSDLGRVAVLYGGISAERDISLQSGKAVLESLLLAGVDAFGVDVKENVMEQLLNLTCDRAFIVLHGIGGEDGKIQALLEWLNIPYTGSGMQASAIALDKLKTKVMWRGANLSTPEFVVLEDKTDYRLTLERLGGECFVKPVREGSSLGMSIVKSADDLKKAHEYAGGFDSEVFAERRINGREYTVAIVNNAVLPPIELRVKNTFYDYDAKYLSEQTEYICPCDLSESESRALSKLALDAYLTVGCTGWGRVDFMLDNDGTFYLLEVNTVPGMTSHSLVPIAASQAGLAFDDLLLEILVDTLEA